MVKETITQSLLLKAEKLLKDMTPGTNEMEIPDSNGLKIVRMDSDEFKKKQGKMMFFEIPGNNIFCISTS
ncbi:MAG: hypothetical protein WC933_01320 [Candidatus Paceibacterota bacterium]|jgi:hypothetical protein